MSNIKEVIQNIGHVFTSSDQRNKLKMEPMFGSFNMEESNQDNGFPTLYDMLKNGTYKKFLDPTFIPEPLIMNDDEHRIFLPTYRWVRKDAIETRHEWYITMYRDKDGEFHISPEYKSRYVELHPSFLLIQLHSGKLINDYIKIGGVYELNSNKYVRKVSNVTNNESIKRAAGDVNKTWDSSVSTLKVEETMYEPKPIKAEKYPEEFNEFYAKIKNKGPDNFALPTNSY